MMLSPLTAVLVSILVTLPAPLSGDGFFGIIYLFTIGPLLFLVAGVVWLFRAARASGSRRLCHTIGFLLLFPAPVTAILRPSTVLMATHDAKDFISWQFERVSYSQPKNATASACLPHVIWRTWGFLSVWTKAYLVFDQANTLAFFAFRGGDVPGVPSGVWHVLPLQNQWYVVTLSSGETWGNCT